MIKIAIGSDHIGYALKEDLKKYLFQLGLEPVDLGCHDTDTPVDYPDIAFELSHRLVMGDFDRGVLICGTGIGMAIAANKVLGVRAACCHDVYSAERSRKSNNAQIITMGSLVITPLLARRMLSIWLDSEFEGGRSAPKVAKIVAIERQHQQKLIEHLPK